MGEKISKCAIFLQLLRFREQVFLRLLMVVPIKNGWGISNIFIISFFADILFTLKC